MPTEIFFRDSFEGRPRLLQYYPSFIEDRYLGNDAEYIIDNADVFMDFTQIGRPPSLGYQREQIYKIKSGTNPLEVRFLDWRIEGHILFPQGRLARVTEFVEKQVGRDDLIVIMDAVRPTL